MSYRLWLPFVIGLIILPTGAIMAALLPVVSSKDEPIHSEAQPLLRETAGEHSKDREIKGSLFLSGARTKIQHLRKQVIGRRNFQLLIGVFYAPHGGHGAKVRAQFYRRLSNAWERARQRFPRAWPVLAGDANLPRLIE